MQVATEFFLNYTAITTYCKTDFPTLFFSYTLVLIQTFTAGTPMPFVPTVGETQGFSPKDMGINYISKGFREPH